MKQKRKQGERNLHVKKADDAISIIRNTCSCPACRLGRKIGKKGGSANAVGGMTDAMMARAPVRRLVGIGAVQLPAIQNTEPRP